MESEENADDLDELRQLWQSRTFRQSIAELLRLDPSAVADLANVLDDESAVSRRTGPEGESRGRVVAAYQTLYFNARRWGADSVVSTLKALSKDELGASTDLWDALHEALKFQPTVERSIAYRDAETLVLPIVKSIRAYLDLRAVSPPSDQDDLQLGQRVELIPVIIVRLEMDELVGGSGAIVAQLPLEEGLSLNEQISAILEQRQYLSVALPPNFTESPLWGKAGRQQ